MDTEKLALARQLANEARENGDVRLLAGALDIVLEEIASADQQQQNVLDTLKARWTPPADASAVADTEPAQSGLIEAAPPASTEGAAPPPLVSSIPPGLYEAPRSADGASLPALAIAPSNYEPLRNADGSIASAAPPTE